VIDHLDSFILDIEEWLSARAQSAASERDKFAETLAQQRRKLRRLDLRAQRAREQYERLLDRDQPELADEALEQARRFKLERDDLEQAIASGEQQLAGWPTAPDVDAVLDFYTELGDAIQGRLSGSQSLQDVRTKLRGILAEAKFVMDGETLWGQFQLRVTDSVLSGRTPMVLELENGRLAHEARRASGEEVALVLDLPDSAAAAVEQIAQSLGREPADVLREMLVEHVTEHREELATTS
jgi:hypothetical protein